MGIDGQAAFWANLDLRGTEVQGGRVAGATCGHEDGINAKPAAGVELKRNVANILGFASGDLIFPEKLDAELPIHCICQRQ
jgi:hypothetical protein